MSTKKTLGGDRIGSGSKMKVELHGYERSTFDLSYIWRSTMAAGTLVPFMCEVALPGDTFDIDLNADIKTHPTLGPLFGSYKVQLDTYQAPIRLYNALLHNNALNIGRKMSQVKLPQMELTARPVPAGTTDVDNSQINPSSLLSYLGIRGVGITFDEETTRRFNATAVLAYWEIYKNYYANKQEEIGAVVHTPSEALVESVLTVGGNADIPEYPVVGNSPLQAGNEVYITYTINNRFKPYQIVLNTLEYGPLNLAQLISSFNFNDSTGAASGLINNPAYGTFTVLNWRYKNNADLYDGLPQVSTFNLVNIDTMRNTILGYQSTTEPYIINNLNLAPYSWLLGEGAGNTPNVLSTQEGLALKTYQSDLFNNWLSTEWIDGDQGVNQITAISTAGGSFTLDTLNLSKKVYDMLNRIAVSGGTYDDWLDAVYDHPRHWMAESPIYHGGLIKELVFQEVVSNNSPSADSTTSGDPLGTLAGKGIMAKKHKGGHVVIKVDEPSYIIGLISLTPRVDYSQGNKWDVHLKTMDDFHKPALDEIGFQDLQIEQMAWWDTYYDSVSEVWRTRSAGKQPAWINYMTNVNVVRGNFAIESNEMFMTLNRRYEWDGTGLKDLTTYIDPAKFNFIFAETARDAQNFWAQISVDIKARRKMSSKIMPNL